MTFIIKILNPGSNYSSEVVKCPHCLSIHHSIREDSKRVLKDVCSFTGQEKYTTVKFDAYKCEDCGCEWIYQNFPITIIVVD